MSSLPRSGFARAADRGRAGFPSSADLAASVRKRRSKSTARRAGARLAFEWLEDLTLLSASITGTVWNDQGGSGVRQGNDPGVAGETVYLDLNGDHTNDGSAVTVNATDTTITATPGPLGGFGAVGATVSVQGLPAQISDLQVNLDLVDNQPAGSAPIAVDVISPLGLTVPDLPTLFNIQPGEHFVGAFDASGAQPITLVNPAANGSLTGTFQPQNSFTEPPAHIYDGNPNGTWGLVFFGNTSGIVINSWSLTFKVPDPSVTTNASGNYSFTGLAPGTYQVEVAGTPNQSQTSPAGTGTAQTVTVGNGQTATGVDFGIQPASELTTEKFYLKSDATDWGKQVTIYYTIANQGLGDAPKFDVAVALSSDGAFTSSNPVLDTVSFPNGLAAGASTTGSVTVTLPAAPPSGFTTLANTEIGFLIDPTHGLPHNNPATDANQGPGYDMTQLAQTSNAAVTTNPESQNDPSIAVDPNNPNHIVVAYMDSSLVTTGYAGIGVSVSEDGGKNWTPSAPVPLPVGFSQGAADPTVQFNAQGQVFIEFMAATFLGAQPGLTQASSNQRLDGFQSNNGIFVVGSTNGGVSWSQPSAVVSHTYTGSDVFFEDDPSFAVDTYKTLPDGAPNPYFGDLYLTWVRVYPPGEFPGDPTSTGGTDIMVAVSADSGQTWTTQTQTQGGLQITVIKDANYANDGSGASGKGDMFYPQVSIGPEGDIYVSAYAAGGFDVFHSTNNGASFVAPNPAEGLGLPFPGINVLPYSTLFGDNFRTTAVRDIVADPSHPGRVYVSDANYVLDAGVGGIVDSGEILFAVSNDYGQTWDPIFQVGKETTNLANLPPGENDAFLSVLNDDDNGNYTAFDSIPQLNNEVLNGQVFPSMAVDSHGNLTVIWYDTRLDPMFQQNLDVYGTVSTDGGKTFSPNFRITNTSFNPNAGNFTDANGVANDYMGDHIAVAAVNGVAYAVWTTTVGGNQNIEFQSYSLTTPPAPPVDRLSPDNTSQTATNLGYVSAPLSVPTLAVGAANDNWFSVTAGANGAIVVTTTATAGDGGNLDLELTDANGNPLTPAPVVTPILNASGTVIGNQLVYSGGVAGDTYLVRVHSGDQATIGYTLTVSALTGDLGTSVTGTQAGNLPNGGLSLYRLEAAVTGSITLTLTPGNDPNDVFTLQVLSPNGQTVLAAGPSAGSSSAQTISLPVTAGEVVLIQVSGGDPSAASSAFTLGWTNFDQYQTSGAATQFFPTPSTPSSIAVADLSNNGVADIITSSTTGSDPISVLMGNGNGTFQAAHQYDVGPGLSEALTAGYRQIGVADLTGSGIPDIIVPNFRAGDISVLLGNGDGTFQPQRTFDGAPNPDALVTGQFTTSGHTDVAVLQNFPQEGGFSQLAILLGRGDGTFQPAQLYSTIFSNGAGPMVVGDFTGNGIDDILVFSKNAPEAQIFLGNGDGTFRNGGVLPLPEAVFAAQAVDLADNGKLDLILTGTNTGNVYVLMGNGDGTFQKQYQTYAAMTPGPGDDVGVYGLAVADFGSPTKAGGPGAPDGHLDILVTAQSRTGAGAGEVIMLPGLVDAHGQFAGFGAPVVLATVATAGKIATGDFTGNGATDIAVADNGGVTVVYGEAPGGQPTTITPNNTPTTARDLGSASHLVTQPETIVPDYQDAYFTYKVPTEAVAGSGAEVVDLSALYQDVQGAGLVMSVTDASGTVNVVGDPSSTGDRYRVIAPQGDVLTIEIYGAGSGATLGSGVYTLDVDVLPQVVSVQAPPVLPGAAATSIVITLQGDRLDPSEAENPANYVVTWLGPSGGEVIPVAATHGGPAVVYDPSANVDISSGLSYATAVRQTITLLFANPLPAGSYEITLAPAVDAAAYSAQESAVLVGDTGLGGHSMVSVQNGYVVNGSNLVVKDLVAPADSASGVGTIDQGTAFLTQLQGDLSALLNQYVTASGDDPSITANLNDEILSRLGPLFAPVPVVTGPVAPGTTPSAATTPTFTVIWFDPVSIDLQAPQGGAVSYSLSSNAVTNSISQTFVQVGGNVELLVLANASGTFNLDVSNVPSAARGGEVQLSANGSSSSELTGALREGTSSFQFDLSSSEDAGGGSTTEGGGGTVAAAVSTGLALFSTGVIATPATIGTTNTNAATEAESPEGAVETAAATSNTATAPIPTPMPLSSTSQSSSEDMQLVAQGASFDNLRPLLQSTLQFVKKVTSQVSGVVKALGLGKGLISIELLDDLLDALTRPAAGANPGAGADGGPARNDRANEPAPAAPAARVAPAVEVVPADAEAALDALDRMLHEQNLGDRALEERNLAGPGKADKAAEVVDAYWAVAFLAAGAYHARLRSKVRHRSEPGEAAIGLSDANDR